jgi:hypothetical protein
MGQYEPKLFGSNSEFENIFQQLDGIDHRSLFQVLSHILQAPTINLGFFGRLMHRLQLFLQNEKAKSQYHVILQYAIYPLPSWSSIIVWFIISQFH